MVEKKITIDGTVRRTCPICGYEKECNCFKINGKNIMICRDCTFKKYGAGKPEDKKPCEELIDYITPYMKSKLNGQLRDIRKRIKKSSFIEHLTNAQIDELSECLKLSK